MAFVIELDLLAEKGTKTASQAVTFLDEWRKKYWPACKPIRRKKRKQSKAG